VVDFPEPVGPVTRRHAKFFQRNNGGRNVPKDGAQPPLLHKHVDTKTGDVSKLEGKVTFSLFLKRLSLRVAHHVVDEGVCFVGRQGRVIKFFEIAMNANHRRFAGTDVTVGGTLLDRER